MQEFDQNWQKLSEEVLTGMKEWREQHPKATLNEIEEALDERLGRLRAQMLQDAALASYSSDWSEAAPEERPVCSLCGTPLVARGRENATVANAGRARGRLNPKLWGLSHL